jgi:4-hydroxybenzoate polyprenyltransferase
LKIIAAFFRLIRWQNLLFIALTQLLFMYCVIKPIITQTSNKPSLNPLHFSLLVLSSVLIAAAGYVINDYFDLNIDRINKPHKLIVQKIISRRYAIAWHFFLSIAGIAIGFYLDFTTHVTLLGFSNLACACLLFLYSVSLKKKLLAGNILISLLTAWTVLVVTWCEARFLFSANFSVSKILRITILYAGFAFVTSLVREAIKDMEDVEGDRKYGCKTMPIIWGINASKIYTAVWMIMLVITLLILQVYVLQFRWWFIALYCLLFVFIPLVQVFIKLFKAQTPQDFHRLSSMVKFIMLTGILSMIFFRFYH